MQILPSCLTASVKLLIILSWNVPHQEICLCDPPVVMALVDGPTGENDNMICVAYKHQFDLINESTGDAYRLHHVDANRVRHTCALTWESCTTL